MDREEYLSRAKDHLFMTGINDNGMKLCAANMVYGIAKIHFLQEKLGLKADATFISEDSTEIVDTLSIKVSIWGSSSNPPTNIPQALGKRSNIINSKVPFPHSIFPP